MRFFNNTQYQTLTAQDLLDSVKHYLAAITKEQRDSIESIELNDKSMTVFGIECILLEVNVNEPLKVTGTIRWFDESSGEGMIRLDSGTSVWFHSCNCIGADSMYPELVTNIQFTEGQRVSAEIDDDGFIFRAIGLTSVKAA
jgi:cold shock CspA family protein